MPRTLRPVLIVVAAWTAIAIAWTPPTALVGRMMASHAPQAAWPVFLYVFLGFVPWMAATPLILRLCRRFPVVEGKVLRNLAIHIAAGIVIIPAVTLVGALFASLMLRAGQSFHAADLIDPVVITSLYSVPTYVAVVGIGQALGYFERYRARERLLARAEPSALQAQLRPHFLFNALNAIAALGYRDPANDAVLIPSVFYMLMAHGMH